MWQVAICRTDDFEINHWLVENGLAVAYRCGAACDAITEFAIVMLRQHCVGFMSAHAMAACRIVCREYSSDFVAAEDAAKAAKRGIWAGAFDIPADWRKERKVLAQLLF